MGASPESRTKFGMCFWIPGPRASRVPRNDGGPSDFRQAVEIGAQHVALEHEIGELAVADDVDQARRLKLLEMVGEGGGADLLALVQRSAGHRPGLACADRFEHLVAPRLS